MGRLRLGKARRTFEGAEQNASAYSLRMMHRIHRLKKQILDAFWGRRRMQIQEDDVQSHTVYTLPAL
jgi:hypothetical protein